MKNYYKTKDGTIYKKIIIYEGIMFALKRLPKFRPVCIQCPYVNIVNPVGYIECTNLDIGEVCCRLSLLAGNKKNMANIVGDDYRLIYIPIVKNVKIDKNENYEFE